jgi:hypothetical protein
LGVFFGILVCGSDVHAIKDKENQGRWAKPTHNDAPDKEVPGFLVNLGPTGARAVLTDRTFVVRYIFANSPAVGRLKMEDVITGAFGRPFSAHTFGGDAHGYEGPIMDLGLAIERAEAKDGTLVLNVLRDSKAIEVKINLAPLGAFSATYPLQCRKSDVVRAAALKYLAEHPDAHRGNPHTRCAVALALLTSENPQQQALGKSIIVKWGTERPDANTWTWNLSYQLIALCEYHLLTKDAAALPAIKVLVDYIEKAQYSGRILVWDKARENEDYTKVDAAQQLYDGGFGHAPYQPGPGKNGYGPMQYTTILAVIARQLAARCGVPPDPDKLRRSMEFIHRGTNRAGYVAYGGEFTLNAGLVDPVQWRNSTSGSNYVGRVGASIVAHKLSPEFPASAGYIELHRGYCKRAFKSMPDGHADSNLGIFWGLMGAAASHDNAVFRTMLDYHKALFNMMRCHDGSFVLLPGRDYADDGYYMASRYHPTATMALTLGLSYPKLRIEGVEASIPGVNPAALKGKMDAAYKAIVEKAYRKAALALAKPRPEDAELSKVMMSHIDSQWQAAITGLEAVETSGDIMKLEAEVARLKNAFKGIEGFDQKIKRFDDGLRKDPWKKEATLGKRYLYYLGGLQRFKSPTHLKALEKFAQANPDSIYGKWATAVVEEFRAKGTISVSSDGKPGGQTVPDAPDAAPRQK